MKDDTFVLTKGMENSTLNTEDVCYHSDSGSRNFIYFLNDAFITSVLRSITLLRAKSYEIFHYKITHYDTLSTYTLHYDQFYSNSARQY